MCLYRSGYFDPKEVFKGSAQQFRDRYDKRLPGGIGPRDPNFGVAITYDICVRFFDLDEQI